MLPGKIDRNEALKFLRAFVTADTSIVPSADGRNNILLLGMGGEGHEGSDLTDTILFVSIPLEKNGIKMISIPRDIWVPPLRTKINSAYYWGIKNEVGGTTLAKTAVEPVLGTEIHYTILLDFNGFKRIIDELGGIEVNVENTFTDPKYPIAGKEEDLCGGRDPEYKCRYEAITFNQGIQKMDGETALKFVRSRHADGDEGTDFARSARQQRVIEGIKNKLLTKEILMNRTKIQALWNVGNQTLKTDIPTEVMGVLARKAFSSKDDIDSQSIPEDLLENPKPSPKYDQLYVLIPKAGDNNWTEINGWVRSILD
jgi:LCP family protein required for cell wall assembly